jgi:hypothetical protein
MNKNAVEGATCKESLQVQKEGAREAEVVAICGHLSRLKFFQNNPKEEK